METHKMTATATLIRMPSKLKKITVILDPELEAALESYALRSQRSLSQSASILLEQSLIVTGDLKQTIDRREKRGGKRVNAGRKPVEVDETNDLDN
jgi:hypothetical protein